MILVYFNYIYIILLLYNIIIILRTNLDIGPLWIGPLTATAAIFQDGWHRHVSQIKTVSGPIFGTDKRKMC